MFRIEPAKFLENPFQTSVFLTALVITPFLPILRPPFAITVLVIYILARVSIFFGARFAEGNEG